MRLNRRALLAAGAVTSGGCTRSGPAADSVTVYVSLDEPLSRPVLDLFREKTGIRVRAIWDTEANKSRGLAARIISERERPRADLWWSSEILQTLRLAEEGLLASHSSAGTEAIPESFRDPQGFWTGFAARFRVFAVRKDPAPPLDMEDLLRPAWKNRIAMARPLWGTTFTEACALFQLMGDQAARSFYRSLRSQGVRLVDGNSRVVEAVARRSAGAGLTDTDDVFVREAEYPGIRAIFPGQASAGSILIPNSAGLVRGGPNPAAARRLLDFLVSTEVEQKLAYSPSAQLPLNPAARKGLPERVDRMAQLKVAPLRYSALGSLYTPVSRFLSELFLA